MGDGGKLLRNKRAPAPRLLAALALGVWICGTFWMLMNSLHDYHEMAVAQRKPGVHLVTLAFPLTAALALVLLIPLFGALAAPDPSGPLAQI